MTRHRPLPFVRKRRQVPQPSLPRTREPGGGDGAGSRVSPASPRRDSRVRGKDGELARASSPHPWCAVVGVLLLFVLAAGCGRKGAPRAPELAVPASIADLTARVEDRGIRLDWSRPRVALDGRALTDLAAFVVFRKGTRSDCPECRTAYRERAVLSVEDEGRFFRESRYGFTDRDLRAGTVYRYRVLTRLSDGSASGPSNEVSVEWRP